MKHATILYLTSSAAFAASTAGPGGLPAALLALLAIVALPAILRGSGREVTAVQLAIAGASFGAAAALAVTHGLASVGAPSLLLAAIGVLMFGKTA